MHTSQTIQVRAIKVQLLAAGLLAGGSWLHTGACCGRGQHYQQDELRILRALASTGAVVILRQCSRQDNDGDSLSVQYRTVETLP